MKENDLDLARRTGLPPALRVLVQAMPRATWAEHPDFGGMAAFWLDRHLMFRRLTGLIRSDAEARLDGRLEAREHAQRLSRLGGRLLGDLRGHHQIEDMHFFPEMARLEPRVARVFELLDADHHVLEELIAGFADAANAVIGGDEGTGPTGAFHAQLLDFDRLLARHLEDEEEVVVPVILIHGMG